jgi:hypothetical protein
LHVFYVTYYKRKTILRSSGQISSWSTIKPAHAATSIKQSPVLKGHLSLVLS